MNVGDFTATALRVAIYLGSKLPLGSVDEGVARIGLEHTDIAVVNALAENETLIDWCMVHGIDCHLFNLQSGVDEETASRKRGQNVILASDAVLVLLSTGMYDHHAALIIGAALGVPQAPLYVTRV